MLSVSGRGMNSQTTVEAKVVTKTASYRKRALLTVLVVNGTIIGFEALLAYNGLSLKWQFPQSRSVPLELSWQRPPRSHR